MRVPYSWLREWVPVPWPAAEVGSRLTMAGFELEALEPAAPEFSGVVVAEILEASRHPQADKLQVCRVSTGSGAPVQIVCGAPNARAGLKSALATVGAKLPGMDIKAAKLRGVESMGMLCSAKELGLADSSSGILELPADAPVGMPLREYLGLDDTIIELSVTANRGDAMSVIGVAREVAALSGVPLAGPKSSSVSAAIDATFPVTLDAKTGCPKFVGRVIRGVNNRAVTPLWMRERLRRAGVRSISPIVDVTNYVMLELGQPMHAYDRAKLNDEIIVRFGKPDEPVTLLDGSTVTAGPDVLLITDRAGPVGVAGIMGGQRTSVSAETTDVFLEVAYFAPEAIRGRARRWNMATDASQRYERGVDPALQERAVERATELMLAIAGGRAGPAIVTQAAEYLPQRAPVTLRKSQLARLLGTEIEPERVTATLRSLGMQVETTPTGWTATPPSHRFDITIEADLIEEVARIVGFDSIPEQDALVAQQFRPLPEEHAPDRAVYETLTARGYYEAITYAFVDPAEQKRLFPDREGLALANAIAADLSVMRVSLWPGLLRVTRENQRRQQDRIRLFERGTRFASERGTVREIDTLSGVAYGPRLPEQWGLSKEARSPADFFDVKADVEALLAGTGAPSEFTFEADSLSCLHPGRAARIRRGGKDAGWIGELHPTLVREMDLTYPPVLFELDIEALAVVRPAFAEISRFPAVRRDLALVVDEGVPLSALRERVVSSASKLLRHLRVFDVYRGPGLEPGRKSVALGLIFQDITRTLTDEDADRAVASVVADLRVSLNAKIRE
ncbi:MAG TPA: phenylalanine--tRNA ligase subunit beta [Steroidobacteraceae bacterium]|nr:phenylalanine--tRNA ligase subunit beta [Steroidobacteraceae bacterium]